MIHGQVIYSGGFPVGYMVEGVGYQYSLIVLVRVYRLAFERS